MRSKALLKVLINILLYDLVLSFDADKIEEMHQRLETECRRKYLYLTKDLTRNHCPGQLDSAFGCWPPVSAGSNITIPCPSTFFASGNVTQSCSEDGEWINFGWYILNSKKESLQCQDQPFDKLTKNLDELVLKHEVASIQDLKAISSRQNHSKSIELMIKIIYWICIFSCIFSLIILSWLYPLINDRINLHRNLIATNLLLCISALIKEWDVIQSETGCNVTHVIYTYFFVTSFAWMLNEGVYQFRAIYFVFIPNMSKFRNYVIFGYGFPAIVVLAVYLPFVIRDPPLEKGCLHKEIRYKWDYIPFGTVHLLIGLNFVIMVYLLYIIFTKVKTSSCSNKKKSWKTCRSFFMLLTLLGGQFIFTLYYPEPSFPYPDQHAIRMAYVINFFVASPSFFICLLQVFLSKEIYHKLKLKWSRLKTRLVVLKEDHTISRMSSTKTMKSSVSWTKDSEDPNDIYPNMGKQNEGFDTTPERQMDYDRRQSFVRLANGLAAVLTSHENKETVTGCDNESYI